MTPKRKRPNILLVMPDQMRGDCLSLAGHPVLNTPEIDRIGRNGIHFSRAYTTCPSCIPARRALLTGQFPSTSGVVGYREGVPIRTPTITQLLREAGYFTAIAGRYMHQSPADEPYGFERRILGSTYIRDDAYAAYLEEQAPGQGGVRGIGLSCNGRNAKAWPLAEKLHPTNWTVRQAKKLIAEGEQDRPLFVAASFYSPHPPLFPPRSYFEQYLEADLPPAAVGDWEVPPLKASYEVDENAHRVVLEGEELRYAQAGYFGLIGQIDDLLGPCIDEFKQVSERQGRPWIIVFTSDHGEMLGDHCLYRKCEPYEGSAHIPLLIQGSPALDFAPGTHCDRPVCLEDIMPTLLDLAAIPVPDYVDGKSLVPILRGTVDRIREILHGEHATCYDEEQGYHSLTDGRMKYIWRPANGREQLFDLQRDPSELHDLTSEPDSRELLIVWRERLIKLLKDRPEGFSDGTKLISGCDYPPVMPQLPLR